MGSRARLTPRPPQWDAKLTPALALKDGRRLVTLGEAGRVITESLTGVTKSAALEHAIKLLMAAAENPTRANRASAIAQVDIVLRAHRLID